MSSVTETPVDERPCTVAASAAEAQAQDEPPVTVLERRSDWRLPDLSELWRYRELLFFLAWRDVKIRYKQTVLGAAWALLQPLATMAAFALFLGRVASAPDAAMPYALYVFGGLLPWTFFSAAVAAASGSVVANERLVTKIYFPRLIVPLSAAGAPLMDLLISFALLLVLMPFFGVWPGWGFLALPLVFAVAAALAAGLGVLQSALTVAYRDFRVIVPLALQLGMFATPAIFLQDLSVLGPGTTAWLPVNPMHGVIVNFRAAALGGAFDLPALGVSALWAALLFLGGCLYFRRVERGFADII
jgi:lipopolysaccharide transport system permease protein